MKTKNIAIILAGGSGQRLGGATPKQFLKVAGKMVLEHTIDTFEASPHIHEICIVTHPDYLDLVEDMITKSNYRKVQRILPGGSQRYDSSLAAIEAYTDDDLNLIFHDAVRPLISGQIIADCIAVMDIYDAVGVAVDTTDTILELDSDGCVRHIPNRSILRNAQTPQCFRRGVIHRAYVLALADPSFCASDDCGVVLRYLPDVRIGVVRGDVFNFKLTYNEDLLMLDLLLNQRGRR